jgi:YggT family protein
MIVSLLIKLINIIEILLLIRAVLSWIPDLNDSKLGQLVYRLTEPMLLPIRNIVNRSVIANRSMIDISFLVAIVIFELLKSFLGRI